MTDFEREDMELKGIMGDLFEDLTQTPTAEEPKKVTANTTHAEKAAKKPARKPTTANESVKDDRWQPVKPAPNFMDKLKQTARDVCLYALLSMILFYWQQTGKLDYTTAWYALLVCVGMVFFAVGKNWRGWCE